MAILRELRSLTSVQRNTFAACFLGWSLDALDFFLLTVCLSAIAAEFHVGTKDVAESIFWTLVMRPVGALLFPPPHGPGMYPGWRVMFMIGSLPALLAFSLQFKVEESPAWLAAKASAAENINQPRTSKAKQLLTYLPSFLFVIILMTAFT